MSVFGEMLRGFADWRRWAWLGWNDVRLANRRSLLGMWWPTLSIGIFVFGVGLLFASVLDRDVSSFLPYVALGWTAWNLISNGVVQGTLCFINAKHVLLEAVLPVNAVPLRALVKLALNYVLSLLVVVAVFFYVQRPVGWEALLILPGLIVNLLTLHGAMLLLGILATRVRDIQMLVEAGMRLAFFLTPIIWMPTATTQERNALIDYNPFYYMIEIMRAPVLGELPSLFQYAVAVSLMLLANLLALVVFKIFKSRLVYWL